MSSGWTASPNSDRLHSLTWRSCCLGIKKKTKFNQHRTYYSKCHLIFFIKCETNSVTPSSRGTLHFVPSILLWNIMSRAPKIDEIAHAIITMDAELTLFGGTWLSSTVPDELININGYQIFRRDRVGWQHGDVCLYVKSSIKCSFLVDYYHPDHKILWADLRPSRLPRGFSYIIVGVVYQ